jgi:hypothetical protein
MFTVKYISCSDIYRRNFEIVNCDLEMLIRYGAKMTPFTSTSFTSSVFHPQCLIIFLSRSNGSFWFPQSHKSHSFGSALKKYYSFWFCWSFDFDSFLCSISLHRINVSSFLLENTRWERHLLLRSQSLPNFIMISFLSLTCWTVFVVKYKRFCVTCNEFHHILFDLVLVQYIARITY